MSSPVRFYHNTPAMADHVPPFDFMPEAPQRIVTAEAYIREHNIMSLCEPVLVTEPLSEEAIAHEYGRAFVRRALYSTPAKNADPHIDPVNSDIYWSAGTWLASRIAAAAAVAAVEDTLRAQDLQHTGKHGHHQHAFCLVRPPGHHCFDIPEGFCILNNVVLAARKALEKGKRVAIVDWDYHFGDGTAKALAKEENVMFVSIHAKYTGSTGFRQTYPSNCSKNWKGRGLFERSQGRSWNIQWERDDADDAAMAYAFRELLLPALQTFAPDLILVSAGYDAVKGDVLAGMEISPSAFGFLAAGLAGLGVPVIAVLEGGYDPDLLASCVAHTIRGLSGDPDYAWSTWNPGPPQDKHKEVVDAMISYIDDKNID